MRPVGILWLPKEENRQQRQIQKNNWEKSVEAIKEWTFQWQLFYVQLVF